MRSASPAAADGRAFSHQLLQEFFAAYVLRGESDWQLAIDRLEQQWWWQTVFFLGGLLNLPDAGGSDSVWRRFMTRVLQSDGGDRANKTTNALTPPAQALSRPLIVEARHGVVGELLELGAQNRAFRDEPRDGAVRRRQEGTGEAVDCSFEDRLWISARPTVRIVFTRFCKLRFTVSSIISRIGCCLGLGVGREPYGPLDLGGFRITEWLLFPGPVLLRSSDFDC